MSAWRGQDSRTSVPSVLWIAGLLLASWALVAAAPGRAAGATFEIVSLDGPGEGLHDLAPYTPRDGNPGTTLGEARRAAVEFAAGVWAVQLDSPVTLRVGVSFDPLGTGGTPALLGLGGPESAFRDLAGAPRAATWYPSALADRLAGVDLEPGALDLVLQFNSEVDGPVLFGDDGFDYGFDPQVAAGSVWFVDVALHEIGHALGFVTYLDLATGEKLLGHDDAYLVHLIREGATPERLAEMSDAQRAAALRSGELQWAGPSAIAMAATELTAGITPLGNVQMHAPPQASQLATATHFALDVQPRQILSLFYEDSPLELELTRALLHDLGWGEAPACETAEAP